MTISIGIDVGWSTRRRSCALAMRAPFSPGRARKVGGDISVALYFIDELLEELVRLARAETEAFRRAVLVIDGPVGPSVDAVPDRSVDGLFRREGFYNRAPGYPITQGSGLELSRATARILRQLEGVIPVKPWFGGQLPTDGLAVAETNPTPAMALLVPQQDPATLPSRARSKYIEEGTITAKSDWYWRLGAGSYAARVLGDPVVAAERNHERVAGLFTLALATALAGGAADGSSVVALGDRNGIYLVPSDIDATWTEDIQRVGILYGVPRYRQGPLRQGSDEPPNPAAQTLDVAGVEADDPSESQDIVTVTLNDSGGLNAKANDWLDEVEVPCRLRRRTDGEEFTVVEAFRNSDHQYRVEPSATVLAKAVGFSGQHLSKKTPVAFEAVIL